MYNAATLTPRSLHAFDTTSSPLPSTSVLQAFCAPVPAHLRRRSVRSLRTTAAVSVPTPALSGREADVEGQLLAIAYQPMPLLLVVDVLVPALMGLIWRSELPQADVLLWCGTAAFCSLAAFFMWRGFQHAAHGPATHAYWQRTYNWMALLSGISWGMGPSLVIPDAAGTPLLSLFVGLALAVCGVATSTLAAQPQALRLMKLATLLPPAISAWMTQTSSGYLAALTLGAGFCVLTVVARYNSANVVSLVSTQAKLRSILNSSLDAIVEVDGEGLIRGWSRQAELMFGWSAMDAVGRDFLSTVFVPTELAQARRFMQTGSGALADGAAQHEELIAQRSDGGAFPVEVVFAPLKIEGKIHFTVFMADITARKQAEEVIRQQALTDPLTGLPNRRLLASRLEQALANCVRHGSLGALMYLDLDRFKEINDQLGHEAGDELLKAVADRLRHATREGDTPARIGGDEFILMLENLRPAPEDAIRQATDVGHKLVHALNAPYRLGGREVHSTPSIGITLFGAEREEAEPVICRADEALYAAKRAGRNCLRIFQPEHHNPVV